MRYSLVDSVLPFALMALLMASLLQSALVFAQATEDIMVEYARFYKETDVRVNPNEADIVELFSFGCNLCKEAQKNVAILRQRLPSDARFQAYAINSKYRDLSMAAKVFRAAYLAKVEPELHTRVFKYIWDEQGRFDNDDDIRRFFSREGYPQAAIHINSKESDELEAYIARLKKESATTEIPTFLVSGKYKVSWGSDQDPKKFAELILALRKKAMAQADSRSCSSPKVAESLNTKPVKNASCSAD